MNQAIQNIASVFRKADPYVLRLAEYCYKSGAVKSCFKVTDTNYVYASVGDSKKHPYRVQIRFDLKSGLPANSWCNCRHHNGSRTGYCEHVYAVLFYLHNNADSDDIAGERVDPLLRDISEFRPSELIHLEDTAGTHQRADKILKEIENALSPTIRTFSATNKYRLVFVMRREFGYSHKKWKIVPMVQYIKRDGSYGRMEKYNEAKITEEYSRESRILLSKLFGVGEMNSLSNCLGSLVRGDLNNIWVDWNNNFVPAVIREIDRCEILFQLYSCDRGINYFEPHLRLVSSEKCAVIKEPEKEIHTDGFTMFAISGDGSLFYKHEDEMFGVLGKIAGARDLYTHADIEKLRDYFNNKCPDKIKVPHYATRIKTAFPVPAPILTIKETPHLLRCDLFFGYLGKEVSFYDESERLVLSENGEEIVLVARDHNYEDKIYNYIKAVISRESYDDRDYVFSDEPYAIKIDKDIQTFLTAHGSDLIESGYELRISGYKKKIVSGGSIVVTARSNIDWFDVKAEYEDKSGGRVGISIDRALLEKGILNSGSSLIIINKKNIERLKKFTDHGMSSEGELKISKFNFSYIDSLYSELANKGDKDLARYREIGAKLKEFHKIENIALPKRFNGVLRNYQVEGYNWLHFLRRYELCGCLADDMGLGKTVQTLAFLQSLKEKGALKTSLIVVPVNVLANWESELKVFAPDLKYCIHAGISRRKDAKYLERFDLIIVSYQTLRSDIEHFSSMKFDSVILDESQNIKNSGSQTFKAVKLLKSDHRISLTGTPVENNTLELWSQMEFLIPYLLGNINSFRKDFALPIERSKDPEVAKRLRKIIYPFILRRKKEDVAKELPEKNELLLYSEMDEQQSKIYEEHKEFYKKEISDRLDKDGPAKSAIHVFSALLRLRQLALFPSLLKKEYRSVTSCKFELLKDTIEEILSEDHKIIIFSQFVESLKIIEGYVRGKEIKYSYIDGSVSSVKRKDEIARFQNDAATKIFLLSLKAGGVGVNLTSADYVILFDPWWNPAIEMQAIDRAHRIGQTRKVIAYKMITKGTVEEKILELQQRKKDLVNDLITSENGFYKDLSKEDIVGLFE